jgi:hypothetical protein
LERLDVTAIDQNIDQMIGAAERLRDLFKTARLTLIGLDGLMAYDSGQTECDNPYPHGSCEWHIWSLGWLMRKRAVVDRSRCSHPADTRESGDGMSSGHAS